MPSAPLRPNPLSCSLIRLVLAICAALVLILAPGAQAARQAAPPPAAPAPAPAPAPVADAPAVEEADLILMNRTIVRFRARLLGATPHQRAERGQATISAILERATSDDVVVQPNAVGNILLIDGQLAFVLTPDDTDKLAGETLATLTDKTVAVLRTVVAESRESRDSRSLAEGLAVSAGATLVFITLLYLLGRLQAWITRRLAAAIDARAERLKLGGTELIRRDRILAAVGWLSRALFWLLAALLAYTWLARILARFPYTRAWGENLDDYLLGVLGRLGVGILQTLPNLLIALLMFLVARAVVGLLKPVFDHAAGNNTGLGWLDKDTVEPTRKITNILIWIFALVMAYPYLPGAQTEAFKGMSVLIGLMVSLGASSIVGQGAAGLILMYSRTLRTGEYVRIGDHEGTVVAISLFNTRLRTGRGAEITLPNSLIVGNATRNYSRTQGGRGFMLDTTVTIGYDTPWRQVEAMLVEAARRTPGISADPAPRIFQTALSDFYPEYCLVVHATPVGAEPRAQLLSRLHANVQDVFNEYGVQIMSPHYIADPATEKRVAPDNWYAPPARRPDPA
ncbi:mechanosensitive ion channel family protein [uncultured Zoogloea sp.]|uniref:mechanosensitive ion channel family protein n=1 Tax=uncultured Zoogloea sp. TaxID=160237 RepID=UPI00262B9CEC|nr:mechanosensitive ion channel family protein [uncultured Zoogloea sp.]